MDYSTLLTPEILAEMPQNLTPRDQFMWKRNKMNEIKAQKKLDSNRFVQKNGSDETAGQPFKTSEPIEPVSEPIQEPESEMTENAVSESDTESGAESKSPGEFDTDREADDFSQSSIQNTPVRTIKSKSSSKRAAKPDGEQIKLVPKSVMNAMRRVLPNASTKGDLISAFVYIFTNGDCEISESAMEIVQSYTADNSMVPVNEHLDEMDHRFDNLERMVRQLLQTTQAVELCTCYNTFDRRYGSKVKRGKPKETEFRELENLDLLARLRQQAADQRKADELARGREIYNTINGKKDRNT